MAEVGMLAEEMGMAATDGRALAGAGGAAKDEVSAGIVDWIPAYAGMTAEKAGMTAAGMLAEEMGMTATDGKTLAGASGAFYPPLTNPSPTTPSPATSPPSFPSVSVRCRVAAYGHLPSGIQSLCVGDGGLPSMATGFPRPPLTHCGGRPAGMTAEESGMAVVNGKALASVGGATKVEASAGIVDWIPAYAGMTAEANGKALAGGGAFYPPLTTPPSTTLRPATPSPATPSPATPPPSFPSVSVRCRVAAYGHLPSGIQKARKARIKTTRATQCLFAGDGRLPSMATGFPHPPLTHCGGRPAGMTAGEAGMAVVNGRASASAGGAANGKASASADGAYYPPLTTLPPTTPPPTTPQPSFPSVSVRCRAAAYGHLPSGIQKARKARIRTTRATQCLFVGDGRLPSMATGFPRPAGMTAEEAGMAVANDRASAGAGGAYYPPLTTLQPTTPPPTTPPPSFPSVSVRCRVAAYGHLPSGIQKARKVRIRTTRATQCLFVSNGSLPSVATGFPHPPLTHCGGRPAGMTAEESGMAEVGMLAEEMAAAANGKTLAGAGSAFYPPLTTPSPTTPPPATPPPSFPSVSVRCRVAAYGHLPSGIQSLFVGDGGLPSMATGFPHPPLTHCGGRPAGMAAAGIVDWIPACAGMTAEEAGSR